MIIFFGNQEGFHDFFFWKLKNNNVRYLKINKFNFRFTGKSTRNLATISTYRTSNLNRKQTSLGYIYKRASTTVHGSPKTGFNVFEKLGIMQNVFCRQICV